MLHEKKEYTAPRLDDRGPVVEGTLGHDIGVAEASFPPYMID
jgi:hypothetical protein